MNTEKDYNSTTKSVKDKKMFSACRIAQYFECLEKCHDIY